MILIPSKNNLDDWSKKYLFLKEPTQQHLFQDSILKAPTNPELLSNKLSNFNQSWSSKTHLKFTQPKSWTIINKYITLISQFWASTKTLSSYVLPYCHRFKILNLHDWQIFSDVLMWSQQLTLKTADRKTDQWGDSWKRAGGRWG